MNTNQTYEISDTSFLYPVGLLENDFAYIDTFQGKKKRYGVNLKTGWQFRKHNLIYSFSFGLGILKREATQYNRINKNDELYEPIIKSPKVQYFREGSEWLFNFPINCRIGFLF